MKEKPPAWFNRMYLQGAMGIPVWWQWTFWLAESLKKVSVLMKRFERGMDQGDSIGEGEL
jgi:hypothetical protein